jgi:hypothetical protein
VVVLHLVTQVPEVVVLLLRVQMEVQTEVVEDQEQQTLFQALLLPTRAVVVEEVITTVQWVLPDQVVEVSVLRTMLEQQVAVQQIQEVVEEVLEEPQKVTTQQEVTEVLVLLLSATRRTDQTVFQLHLQEEL